MASMVREWIRHAIPENQCLDNSEDAWRVAKAVSKAIHVPARKIYSIIYGHPWCTDNDEEVNKIADEIYRSLP